MTSLGFVAILWGVFHFTNATVGGPVGDFAHRRAYNDTKIAVHEAFPGDFLRAIVGLALVWAGAGMRTSARKMDASA